MRMYLQLNLNLTHTVAFLCMNDPFENVADESIGVSDLNLCLDQSQNSENNIS